MKFIKVCDISPDYKGQRFFSMVVPITSLFKAQTMSQVKEKEGLPPLRWHLVETWHEKIIIKYNQTLISYLVE